MKTKNQQVDRVALRKVRKFFPQVESVRDATKPINIEVSAHDSNHAKLKDHNHCALAVACEKKMHADGVIISVKTAYVVKGKRAIRYKLLETTAREVVSFDRKGGFEPGTYSMKPPPPVSRLGVKTDKPSGLHTSSVKSKAHITTNIRTSLRNE